MDILRTLDLNLLKVFDAIYTCGSISGAAQSLHITQPAVSLALKRLREAVGDPLFIRAHRGMKPTHRANELAGPIKDALRVLAEALEQGQGFDPGQSNRVFRMAFGRYGELDLLPRLLKRLHASNCSATLRSVLDEGQTGLELVAAGDIDGCFDFVEPQLAHVNHCAFSHEQLVVIARRDHPRVQGAITHEQYFDEYHVVMSFGAERRELLETYMSARGGTRKIMTAVNQYLAAPSVVAQTDALATVPMGMATFPVFKEKLQILDLPFQSPLLPTYLMWHQSRDSDPGWVWLRQQILALRTTSP